MSRPVSLVVLLAAACGVSDPVAPQPDIGADAPADVRAAVDATTASDVGVDGGSTNDADNNDLPSPTGATRYLAGPVVQPVTPSVVASMQAIRARSTTPSDDVFMKIGASGTVNTANLTCFGPTSSYRVELDGRDELQATIDRFNARLFDGQSSWDRTTKAAEVGRSASWALAGTPSPIDEEIADINPRFALVNYGTNDMQLGTSHGTALFPFIENMHTLLDNLQQRGIIPIVTGLNPRGDTTVAAHWVPTFDAATRALAEARQLPFIDLYLAVKDLPDSGLVSDGIHGNSYPDGGSQPCVFTAAGLGFNYNVRNLRTLELLHTVTGAVLDAVPATATNPRPWAGTGTDADPVQIDVLPFSHHGDTSTSPPSRLSGYPDCDTGQDEGGPEVYYTLTLEEATPLRVIVLDRGDVDVDVHLLAQDTCLARNDRMIQGTFGPGEFTVVTDTFVSAAGPQVGAFTLVVLACEPGDGDCS